MTQYGAIKVFEHKRVRSSWDAETETSKETANDDGKEK